LLLAGSIPVALAIVPDSGPYVVRLWDLRDSFQDFSGTALTTGNYDFTFLKPMDLTLTLEDAFFAEDTTTVLSSTIFCGCDRDTLPPNGRTRYTHAGGDAGRSVFGQHM
jgi:hypothetical protein